MRSKVLEKRESERRARKIESISSANRALVKLNYERKMYIKSLEEILELLTKERIGK
jgi:hypothetical protein